MTIIDEIVPFTPEDARRLIEYFKNNPLPPVPMIQTEPHARALKTETPKQ